MFDKVVSQKTIYENPKLQAHNLKVIGSNPISATFRHLKGCLFLRIPPYLGLELRIWRL